jgi:molybdopterin synthase catalytic subunit
MIDGPLPTDDLRRWAVSPQCGAVVVFCGTARDHSEGRPGVTELSYEAYEHGAHAALVAVAEECRRRWPDVGRVGIVHRTGDVPLGQEAVAVVVSAPHRTEAFDAARYAIDAVKASAPIWKRERWSGGDDWGRDVAPIVAPGEVS